MPEEKFLPSLWLLIGWVTFLLALTWFKNLLDCCNKGDSLQFLCVLSQGHKELVESFQRYKFWDHFKYTMIVIGVLLAGLAVTLSVMLKRVDFGV